MVVSRKQIRKGIDDPRAAASHILSEIGAKIEPRLSRMGRHLFQHDWDCAIILDACRYDVACENAAATSLLGSPDRAYSLGANSGQWLSRTFSNAPSDVRQQTHYVTANVFSETDVPDDVACTEVWNTDFDENQSTVPPRPVTDAAIRVGRESSPEKLIVHYMQPHLPPVSDHLNVSLDLDFRSGWGEDNPWKAIERGDIDPEPIMTAYRENLTPVIEEVELLLENLDAERVIVTADHGNMLGELGKWGHYRMYGLHLGVRQVPWWVTSGRDTGQYHPGESSTESTDLSREEKLEALGYR